MKQIVCLLGDGVGVELIEASIELLAKLKPHIQTEFAITTIPFGGAAIDQYGEPFPPIFHQTVVEADAVLLGAIGHPKYDQAPIRPEQALLDLRKMLQLSANVRGLKIDAHTAQFSPLKASIVTGTDVVIVRELIGGAYFGKKEKTVDMAIDEMKYTKQIIADVVHFAFALAMKRTKKLTSVDKANVLATSKLWREVVNEIAPQYPEVRIEHLYVDAMAMHLITKPTEYDVVVMENLFGDILSDELAALAGSLGMLPSASFGALNVALYEPAHGSAPDIAGLDLVNPIAMFLSVAMMLRSSFQEEKAATMIESAITDTLQADVVTKDLDTSNGVNTSIFTQEILKRLGCA